MKKSGKQNKSNSPELSVETPVPQILALSKNLRFQLDQLEKDGDSLLLAEGPLRQHEWENLTEQCATLLAEVPQAKFIKVIYQLVIRKGIWSLRKLVDAREISNDRAYDYFRSMAGEFKPALFGIGSHNCTDSESREMLDSIIPIAQACMNPFMLTEIANLRFPKDDERAINLFVQGLKNWE